jgi:uncharacterized protein YbaP (TraB family)
VRALAVTMSLLCAVLTSGAARAQSPPQEATIDEVVVTSERTGPGFWHVSGPVGEAWLLGTVSPLPKNITWRSRQLEQLLGGTRTVLVAKPMEIGIVRAMWLFVTQHDVLMVPGGRHLKDVMAPELYARFEHERVKYSNDAEKWTRYRPIIATAFLEQAALHHVGLSARLDVGAEVRVLARKHDVPIEEIKIAGLRDIIDALKTMPPETENTCVAGALETIETGLPRLVARADAWVTGNVERIQSLPQSAEVDACVTALSSAKGPADLMARIRHAWLEDIAAHLRAGGSTIAVVNMDLLLEHGGLLDGLRAAGYRVEAP